MHRHGDVLAMVNSDGDVVNTYEYDTYGNITSETEGVINPFKYAGEYQRMPNDMVYLRNRVYAPSLGRFLQEDPIHDGTNWYVYCNSNPVNYWDPTGYITQEEIDMYQKGFIDESVYNILIDLTERYYAAKTDAARDEIHNLAEDFRNNNYSYADLTTEANQQLWDNGRVILSFLNEEGYVDAGLKWYNLVDNKREWDYKINKAEWMPENENYFMFYGKLISTADYGNINYGYTGTILNLSPKTLYKGAGYIQSGTINNNPNEYYGDSEVDYYNVQKGIHWANSIGYKGYIPLPVKELIDIMGERK